MNVDAMRAIFDREQRRDVGFNDTIRDETRTAVRHVARHGGRGFVLYTELTAADVDRVIDEQIGFFDAHNCPFEWKVYEHDRPDDLRQRLAARGFEIEDAEAVMVLDLHGEASTADPETAHDIRRVTDPAGIADVVAVEEQVWNEDKSGLGERLRRELVEEPDGLSVYVAFLDGAPAAAAWINFHAGTQFASLWGGSTLASYRKRGLYTGLLAVRKREAAARGFRFLTVDASPMSEPILARHGFVTITRAWACNWPPTPSFSKGENQC